MLDDNLGVFAEAASAKVDSASPVESPNFILYGPEASRDILWSEGERFHHVVEKLVDDLGTKQARSKVAVEYADNQISWHELETLSNRIASLMIAWGVKPGDRVALLFDRSIFAYASQLATSKCGAVFVPLDAAFPQGRIEFILKDSGANFVATLTQYSMLFKDMGATVMAFDALEEEIERQSGKRPALKSDTADELCYLIYTSGTTGRPKGVQINHSSICNFLKVAVEEYGFVSDDRVYQSLTIAFDYSFEEIWVPLLSRSVLVPAPSGVNLLGSDLAEFLVSNKITALCSVPTILATIDQQLPELRLLITSGEAFPPDLLSRWTKPDSTILNLYGPTETTVSATWTRLEEGSTVTIGQPLPTYSVMVLNPDKNRVLPFGQEGELAIAGIGVSSGYLNRETETARAFIKDFIGVKNNPSGMIYRSGDRVRINEQHEIEYLGRIDSQVKIRGYRIELSEIEAVARESDDLPAIVVNPVETEPGSVELAAYFVADEKDSSQSASIIQDRLKQNLPAYMVPAYFEPIAEIPMLASGKVDRNALPIPSGPRLLEGGKQFVAPADGLEAGLAEVLGSLLKTEAISADADFFDDLGANSLIMARYIGSVRKKLGLKKVSMKLIYEYTTVATLAAALAPAEEPAVEDKALQTMQPDTLVENTKDLASTMSAPLEAANSNTTVREITPRIKTEQPASNPTVEQKDEASGSASWMDDQRIHIAKTWEYYLCGALQLTYMFVISLLGSIAAIAAIKWVWNSEGFLEIYLRSAISGSALFFGTTAFFIAVKWLVWGRFKQQEVKLWSLDYVRFWIAQLSTRANPMAAFAGSPLYNVYLRMLGAKIGRGARIFAPPPVCADLVSIGENSVVRQTAMLTGFTVHRGIVRMGNVEIGDNSFIGEASMMDINTKIGSGSQLGTSSCLHQNHEVPDGEIYQGSPAQKTETDYIRVPLLDLSEWRARFYSVGELVTALLIAAPLPFAIVTLLAQQFLGETTATASTGSLLLNPAYLFGYSVALYFGGILLALLSVMTVPKFFNLFFKPDIVHPLFGFQYYLANRITTGSQSAMLQELFGDSSMILPYFTTLGYDLSESTQNGSNFGVEQLHHSPFLCKFNRNTLVSDGLHMMNMDHSQSSFKMSAIEVPPDAYLGNDLHYPVGAKVGANCLIATKAMVPIDGEMQDNCGILGSPPFAIPRSGPMDPTHAHYKQPGVFEQRLSMKLKSNLITLGLFTARNLSIVFLMLLMTATIHQIWGIEIINSPVFAAFVLACSMIGLAVLLPLYCIMFERLQNLHRPMKPVICSLYERHFWDHERFWKLNINHYLTIFDGTPIKNFLTRCQGVKLGRMVYDGGAGISEPHMVEIGDYACLNIETSLQGHSLEDGTFKSDSIKIGDRSTVGVKGFVHYGVEAGNDAVIGADAFVMKGSVIGDDEHWSGNPAKSI
ncbi:MAG: Pls/PosA family non-ribosomal peptide synthetase [Rhizobiaceae bacterium]